jgi:hypothetical protein
VTVPVLLIVFNRPDLTRRALEALAAAGPDLLMVAADGPRHSGEAELCARARRVVDEAVQPCPVEKDYADANLGCGIRVHTAIDWALSRHDSVIVLEDDCIAAPSFLAYCRELLAHYRDDPRVMHVSGNSFRPHRPAGTYSYHFSKYTHAWGWATWRRAWRHFDHGMRRWPELKRAGLVERWCDERHEQRYWHDVFDRMHRGAPDVWDYQWMFACWAHGGLTAIPRVNLVSNVGTGPDATHTKGPGPYFGLPTGSIGDIAHPPDVVRDEAADARIFDHNFGGRALRDADSLPARLRRRLHFLAPPYRAARAVCRRVLHRRG